MQGEWAMRTALTNLLGIEVPIIQAPMAGSSGSDLVVAVSQAGGLGSLPCAMLTPATAGEEMRSIRARTSRPVNLNFFCHPSPVPDEDRVAAWLARLAPYYAEFGVDAPTEVPSGGRAPFGEAMCAVVEEFTPEVVSFHFGLPDGALLDRVLATGATVLSSATTVSEARWLAEHGCHAVIAQGAEAGGHRGMFRTDSVAGQVGTVALVPQVVDAVDVPVIAAGGLADGRGIAAALALGAAGVQVGTAFLRCPEATSSALHRRALAAASDDGTAVTNVLTGRPARGIVNRMMSELGPLSDQAPDFPIPGALGAGLRTAAEARGDGGFSPLWSGQAGALGREVPAADLVRMLIDETTERLRLLAPG
jgi:nitronate monooxygenase